MIGEYQTLPQRRGPDTSDAWLGDPRGGRRWRTLGESGVLRLAGPAVECGRRR